MLTDAATSKKLKVLFVTRARRKNAGGMERLSWELTARLSQQPEIKGTIIAHGGHRLLAPLFILSSLPRVLTAAKGVDIVHLGDPMLSLVGFAIKKILKKPVAMTVHGLDISYPNPFYQLYIRAFLKYADVFLPISRYVASLLEAFHIPATKIKVVNPGIEDEYYDPSATRAQLDSLLYQDTQANIILLTTGRLVRRKGQAWFVAHVLPHLPAHVIYVMAGSGPHSAAVRQAIKKTKMDKRALMLRRVSSLQLKTLLNTADAFIQPNIPVPGDVEGFGLVLLEAGSSARPVFAANMEGIPDAITDSKNGRLVAPGDTKAWIKVITDFARQPSSAKTAAIIGRTFTLEKFAWQKTISAYIDVLKATSTGK